MSGFSKFIWFIFGLLLIVQSAVCLLLVYNIPITGMVNEVIADQVGLYIVVGWLAITMLGGILMLLISVIRPSRRPYLWIRQPQGRMRISKSAVISLVQKSLVQNFELADVRVQPRLYSGKKEASLTIEAVTFNLQNLNEQGNQIRQRVKNDVQDYLGIPVKQINLHLGQAQKGQKVPVI